MDITRRDNHGIIFDTIQLSHEHCSVLIAGLFVAVSLVKRIRNGACKGIQRALEISYAVVAVLVSRRVHTVAVYHVLIAFENTV